MAESFHPLPEGWLYVRHARLGEGRPTLVMVHGLGESSLSFQESFDHPALEPFALVALDLLGYGRSSAAGDGDYRFDSHVRRLWQLVDDLGLERFALLGHSMGGDLGTLMAEGDGQGRMVALVNVEGDLTPQDIFFSNKVVQADERGQFASWFAGAFREETVLGAWGSRWESSRRYYASLHFCRPEAFLANAREMYARNQPVDGASACATGLTYLRLALPKLFCWGSESLATETRALLQSTGSNHRSFAPASHWPMIDCADDFYRVVAGFLATAIPT